MTINILTYLERQLQANGGRTAVADGERSLTYSGLQSAALRTGSFLAQRLNVRRRPVFISTGRNVGSIIMLLGTVYSGNFYVPIDPSLPKERILAMQELIRPCAVLTDTPEKWLFLSPEIPVLSLAEALSCDVDSMLLGGLRALAKDTDPLYCIFTSGSTGVPKGVLVSHRSVIDMAEQFTDTFGFDDSCVFGNQAPFDFDVSVKDIYIGIKVGARIEILEKKLFSAPPLLIERMRERRVNTLIWAVSAMKVLTAFRVFESASLPDIRRVYFSGEVMPCGVLSQWQDALPQAEFVNLYGPTEITCNCTYHRINRRYGDGERVPIGSAFPNCTVYVINENGQEAAVGETGEIYVAGSCLALGYYAMPEPTAGAFVPSPLQSDFPETFYRTGDLGRMLGCGELEYLGRRDSQIKHMGHRIEPGELEAAARGCGGVFDAACIYIAERSLLCLFYIGSGQLQKPLIDALRLRLPKYMLPNRYVALDKFPVTRTGKTDRHALAAMIMEAD